MMGIGPMAVAVAMTMGGGIGLPPGTPPLPPDGVIENSAPESCLFYAGWAGTAEPDAKSPNHTEQLLAEQEVQEFLAQFGAQVKSLVQQVAGRDEKFKPLGEIAIPLAKLLLT